jgi:hypothetical protein
MPCYPGIDNSGTNTKAALFDINGVFIGAASRSCGAINRSGRRGRPAALGPAGAVCAVVPNRSSSAIVLPGRPLCAKIGASAVSIRS